MSFGRNVVAGPKRLTAARFVWFTMLTEPATARPMPRNFCRDPASSLRHTAIIAVKTGMVGCMQVATSTPDKEMPIMYISWLKNKQIPRAPTWNRSVRFGRTPAAMGGACAG